MTGRPIVAFLSSFFLFLFIVHSGNGQVTLSVSKRNLSTEKAQSLFESGQFDLAKSEIEGLLRLPTSNGILSDRDIENLQFLQVVCGLSLGDYSAAQEAILFLKKAETKSLSTKLAYYLGHYFFELSKFDEALIYLELTDALFLTNDQSEQVQFEKGVSYFSQRKFDNASPYFKSLYQIKTSKYHDDVAYYLGFISFAEKKYKDALPMFLSIAEVEKYKKVIPFYLSFIEYELGNTVQSIQYGEAYLKSGDKIHQTEMLQLMGSLYFNSGNQAKTAVVYEQILEKGVALTNIQKYELGIVYFQQAKYTKAVQQLSPLSKQTDSIGLNAMYVLAQSYLGLGQNANARSSFSYCVSGKIPEPKREVSVFYFAKLSFELGFEDQGMNGISGFISTYPNSRFLSEANGILFAYYAKTNNFKKAIAFLKTNTASDLSDPSVLARVYFGRGMELINELDYTQADVMMEQAVLIKDRVYYGPALFWRGEIAYRNENYDAAIGFFTSYLKSNSRILGEANESNALYSLGYAFFEKEDYKTAQTYFEKLKVSSSEISSNLKREALLLNADCLFMLNEISKAKLIYNTVYEEGGDGADYALYQLSLIEGIKSPEVKIRLLKQAESKFPQSDYRALIFMEIADTYLSEEQFDSAIPYLKRIPQLVNKDDEMIPDALLKLGIAYYNLDQPEDAIDKYRELISAYPSTHQSAEALESAKTLYVEQGKINEYESFLQSSGKSLTTIQKDSLRYQYVQSSVASADIPLAKRSMDQYLSEFPNGLFAIEVEHLQAELYLDEKDWLNAAKSFTSLSERGASRYQEKALRQAAKLYFFEIKDYEKAANLFQQLTSNTSKSELSLEALRGEVRSRYYLKQWMAGIRAAEQLLSNTKANPDDISFAEIILGYFSQMNKEYEKSSTSFERVVNGNQSGLAAEARYQLALNKVEQGNLLEAEQLSTKAIESSGSNEFWVTKSYILLGRIFLQQKDYFNAKATLKSVIENCTIADLKVEAERLLESAVSAEKNDNK